MTVDIPADLVPFVQTMMKSGRYRTQSEMVGQALRLLQDLDQSRRQLREDLLEGINSGPSIPADEVFSSLEKRLAEITSPNGPQT